MEPRHNLAPWTLAGLALAGMAMPASGCFSARGTPGDRDDAGTSRDGGGLVDGGADAGGTTDGGADRCRPAPVDEVRFTDTLVDGQPAVVTVRATRVSTCSCTPALVGGDGATHRLDVCDCCDDCECIDPGYEGTAVISGLGEGQHAVRVQGIGALTVTVVPAGGCFAGGATVDAVTVDGPAHRYADGPRTHWLRIEGTVESCCPGDPQPVASRRGPGTPDALHLEPLHCDLCKVLCADPIPSGYVAWHPLRDLPVGEHRVVVGDVETTFEVEPF